MMPFIGVRISWLILARNPLFSRLAVKRGLNLGAFGDIQECGANPGGISTVIADQALVDFDGTARAVFMEVVARKRSGLLAGEFFLNRFAAQVLLSGRDEVEDGPANHFGRRVAQQFALRAIDATNDALAIDFMKRNRCLFKKCSETLFAFAQILLGAAAFRDVLHGAFQVGLAIGTVRCARVQRYPDRASVLAPELTLESRGRATLLDVAKIQGPLLGMHVQLLRDVVNEPDQFLG